LHTRQRRSPGTDNLVNAAFPHHVRFQANEVPHAHNLAVHGPLTLSFAAIGWQVLQLAMLDR